MNTQKQIMVMVGLIFLSIIATGAYWMWDPDRAENAEDHQLETTVWRGAFLFSQNCRICHGDAGEGGLQSNRLREAPTLNRPDLQGYDPKTGEISAQSRSRAYTLIFNTITCGRVGKAMPTWGQSQGGTLNDEQIRQLTTMIVEGTGWEDAKEFAIEGFPDGGVHGDADVTFGLARAVGIADPSIYLDGDVSALVVNDRIQLDNELTVITTVHVVGLTVARAADGTTVAEHESKAVVLVNGQDTGVTLTKGLGDSADGTVAEVSSLEGISVGDKIQVDDEVMTIGVVNTDVYVDVERGFGNTSPAEHTLEAELLKPPVPPDPPAITESACGQSAGSAEPTPAPVPPSATLMIDGSANEYNTSELRALPGVPLQLTFNNLDDGVQHNWELFASEEAVANGDNPIAATDIDTGPVTQTLDFGPLDVGEYYFQCAVHPGTMFGNLLVQEAGAAPPPTEGDATPAGDAGDATPEATHVAEETAAESTASP